MSKKTENEIIEVQLSERQFIKVYKDFFHCKLLNAKEKIVYIGLKDFVNFRQDSGEVFPSINTLADNCGLDRKTIIKTLQSLEKKGIIKKEQRGLTKTNLYTLKDSADLWQASDTEQMQKIAESKIELSTEEMIAELQRRGAIQIVSKEKRLEISSTDQSNDISSPKESQLNIVTTTSNYRDQGDDCQEAYTLETVRAFYDYDKLVAERPTQVDDIDSYINIIYDLFNTTKKTITISGERKSTNVVIGRLRKLYYEHILYVMDKFNEQTEKIHNPRAYKIKLLYDAYDQLNAEVHNQVQHDLHGNKNE